MPWLPTEKERKFLELIASMTLAAMMGKLEDKGLYFSNLYLIIKEEVGAPESDAAG